MSVFNLFSKRQKKLRGDVPDVYVYDKIPESLRVQIIHVWHDTLGNQREYDEGYNGVYSAYKFMVDTLCREYGLFQLSGPSGRGTRNYLIEFGNFLLQESDTEKILDAVEISFRCIDRLTRNIDYLHRANYSQLADDAIQELNARFREHGVGFHFSEGEIIRIDSEMIHAEVVKPALVLLRSKHFEGAQEEFLKAHEHYRHGNHKEALAESLKAFESVMKAICQRRKWKIESTWGSKALIQACFDNGLIPVFWQQHFTALRSLLESGIPTARNRLGGHGQGADVIEVPNYLVAHVLHMTASAIVFLAEADRSIKVRQ